MSLIEKIDAEIAKGGVRKWGLIVAKEIIEEYQKGEDEKFQKAFAEIDAYKKRTISQWSNPIRAERAM